MGVDLTIVGNHSIPFKDKKMVDKSKLIDLLNSLRLEESEFIKGMCKMGHVSNGNNCLNIHFSKMV